jgi:hypothetical protein
MDFKKASAWINSLPTDVSIKRNGKEIEDRISQLSATDENFTTDDEDGDGNWNIIFDEDAARETLIRFLCWLLDDTHETDRDLVFGSEPLCPFERRKP